VEHGNRIIIVTLAMLVLAHVLVGCVSREASAASGDPATSRTDALVERLDENLIIPCTENDWPANCEVKTIRIQRAIGLYYVPPGTDIEQELKAMNATLIENGALYEAIAAE